MSLTIITKSFQLELFENTLEFRPKNENRASYKSLVKCGKGFRAIHLKSLGFLWVRHFAGITSNKADRNEGKSVNDELEEGKSEG